MDLVFKEVFHADVIFREAADTIDYSALDLDANPYRKFSFNFDYYKSLTPKFVISPGLQNGLSSKQVVATDLFFVGGYRYNLREDHVSFVGFGFNEIFVYNYFKLKLELRYQARKKIYIDVIANWMGEGSTPGEMFDNIIEYNEHVHFGFGGGVTIKSPLGPLSFMAGTNTANFKLRTYLNLGFNF